jgi:superfamily I DNA and/or RNA helicase
LIPVSQLADVLRKAIENVYALSHGERCALIHLWAAEVHDDIVAELLETIESSAKLQEKLCNIHNESDRRILQEAEVIGVTTSGLAKRISVLQHVRSKVVICEETGEVMEAHMISALLPTVEHCIQIGDHEQLRPSINNFKELSLESQQGILHQLDRSQFERLSVGQRGRPLMPVAQLGIQRRMRPEISTLIRQTIYPRLKDHISTTNLPNVVGLRKNVFWFDHRNYENDKESEIQHTKSKSNAWEVGMVLALVRDIVRQGTYDSSEIAILTQYTGQLQKLRLDLRSDFEIVLSDRD